MLETKGARTQRHLVDLVDEMGGGLVGHAPSGIDLNRSQHRIASTNQHRMRMGANESTPHAACGVAHGQGMREKQPQMMSKPLYKLERARGHQPSDLIAPLRRLVEDTGYSNLA